MEVKLIGSVDNEELQFPLAEGVYLIGRSDDAALRIPKPSISRHHAEIRVLGGNITVQDLGSHNGTRVNGATVEGTMVLQAGDLLELANLTFRLEGPESTQQGLSVTGQSVIPNAEISWDEVRSARGQKKDLQSLLFRVLAEAGDLLTIPRSPEEMYDPILDLVETALLKPERIFVLLVEESGQEPVHAASRIKGYRGEESLVLSRTMIQQVIEDKKSFLASDSLDQTDMNGMMSMISQGIRSAIAVPLFDNEDVIGILYADDSRPQRTFSRDQLAAFTLLANTIAVALTHARYHEMEAEKRRQDAEVSAAEDILANILPKKLPPLEGYDVLANLEPCFEVGGDLYFAQPLEDGKYAFLVGDVTGKGLGAALLVSHIMSLTRFMLSEGWEPAALVEQLSRQTFLCTDFVRFATFFLGYLDPATGHIQYVNAGHNPPFLVRNNGEVEECPTCGLPVGMMEDSKYRSLEITLDSGDLLAVFSDGIPETQTLEDEEYGEDNFQKLLVARRTEPLDQIFTVLQDELAKFRGKAPIGDDVTLLTLRRQ